MVLKKMLPLFIAALFVLPISISAFDDWDDFEDDGFGDWDDDPADDFRDPDPFDPEADLDRRGEERRRDSDAAMRDLLGEEEEEDPLDDFEPFREEKKPAAVAKTGFKPILLVKGGFSILGQYKYRDGDTTRSPGLMFGSVDEGLLGGEYLGKYVIAKGTMNLRTKNPFISRSDVVNNPLKKMNYNTINDGIHHGLYELYGGIRLFNCLTIRAGKMMPEYGLIDTHQKLGMGFANPNLTRSLVVVEGYIPETDEGFALGYKGTFANAHTILAGFMIGTGSVASEFWETNKTMGIYGRLGYMHEYFQAAFGFQYRTDYFSQDGLGAKDLSLIGIGVHANVSVAGFEMPISFDYSSFNMIQASPFRTRAAANILLSLAPGYAFSFNNIDWAEKFALAVRFDLSRGVYQFGADDYLDFSRYTNDGMIFRIGATANFFVKEIKGVQSFAGLTFLIQPESEIVKTPKEIDYGFMTLMISAGAEY